MHGNVAYPRGGAGYYRSAFQGQEKDDEIHGATGTSYSYEYRIHDPRIGRFLSIDPLAEKYPFYSPYAFSGNRVNDAVELEGLEPKSIATQNVLTGEYYFTKPAVRLLSYVSGVSEDRIASTMLVRAGMGRAPFYEIGKDGDGGGAMTVWDRIVYTRNFFDPGSLNSANTGIESWLSLSAHEVKHLPQADAYPHTDGGKLQYMASFGLDYLKGFLGSGSLEKAHDQVPRESEAETGRTTYRAFSRHVDQATGQSGAIFHLFNDYGAGKVSEEDAIMTIDSWSRSYQESIAPKE
jgi:RHS repeat-associated protein